MNRLAWIWPCWLVGMLVGAAGAQQPVLQPPYDRLQAPLLRLFPIPGTTQPQPFPGQPLARRWKLGVNVRNLETGVEMRDIFPGSAAERAGLQAGDIVVTVNGFQVGSVLGRENDIADEFERRADAQGRVRFLVQDWQTGHLVNLDVQLDPRTPGTQPLPPPQLAALRGTVSYRERIALPLNAELHVRLLELPPPGTPSVTIAEQTFTRLGQPPIGFELAYDPRKIDPQKTYAIQARIIVDREVRWITTQAYPVLTRGNPTQVNVLVESTLVR